MTLATSTRVARQLRHDPRTVALLVFLPAVLMTLLRYVFDSEQRFNATAPALLGIFPFLLMFMVTSITTLRERSSGTLERLMTTPTAKLDLLVGYALAFAIVSVLSVGAAVLVSVWLGLDVVGSFAALLGVTLLDALLGVALGLFASAFARTEFQAIQLMPVFVLPQILLCGLFHPRGEMASLLRWISDVLPLSYAVDALQRVAASTELTGEYYRDVAVVAAFVVAALVGGAATLRRRTD
ncbi:MAG TPA: ABC transporter permease [Jatrophihabitantaceae bacterium]|nr:ABC transporter permease [Jatrophihabitantaceae bacterium]